MATKIKGKIIDQSVQYSNSVVSRRFSPVLVTPEKDYELSDDFIPFIGSKMTIKIKD